MKELDQELRQRQGKINSLEFEGKFLKKDIEHTNRLKEIIKESGWPLISQVGEDGSNAARLLIQHADHDPEFQRECLILIIEAENRGEAKKQQVAYLTDRVRANSGQPQVFGTQFHKNAEGKYKPLPIEDEESLEKIREEYGLDPFSEYLKFYDELNKKQD